MTKKTEDFHLKIAEIKKKDYPQLKTLMDRVYVSLGGAWSKTTINTLIDSFPEGQIALFDHDKLIGMVLTMRVNYQRFSNPHTYDDLLGQREIIKDDPEGDALYGIDALIDPDYRGYRLGRRLYDARKELCRQMNFRAILAGGRIPKYHNYQDMTPGEYIDAVENREIYDPTLSFQLSNGFIVKRILTGYLPDDKQSKGFATLLEWANIYYEPQDYKPNARKTDVRIGGIQWQMREVESPEELLQQVEFFVDIMADYNADFACLPEFFNAPLMGLCESTDQNIAIRFLADYTEWFKNEISNLAVSYNVNVITGSMPLFDKEAEVLYNVSYLCRRDGTVEEQRKIHITPHERSAWVIEGGNKVQVFDTDAGRIGILVCYDVEFPELARLLALEDMDILFVPFWTDTKNGYLRVRHCAQARAIENECYVMICGSVGNLPQVESLDIQYAQSSVFSPSDFAFPHDAIMAETTPNTEMVFFSDLDLDKLIHVRNEGSVNNLKDRRDDIFTLKWKKKAKQSVENSSPEELKQNSHSVREGVPLHDRATKPS
ncbi:carbon-nitrogen hydrolase family protein [Psychrobacter sanguinis]|uniref:carbon-nitrogen hydrolase family protein n=1 Tax=Psychrobacter sanguinis TaxID=861445 RepID=UPI00020C79B1|nr:bifunctional GNAT family N-acetyltransferase/carbon-nitrogen hydrolase family protein [Psychrobacter sanguinis]EGK14540.1 carbon-nitrogen family hydrolase [Psychrobacter sp. 1501(2011)]MCD9150870.1 bifunctional GNAT family N-acetyltransferase/carbon-nitrogen hydrolase family protein [Psychrobacter sanguinis]